MRRNRGVWFVSLATASSLLGDQMLYAVLPTIYADLGLQPYHVGILLSANRVVRLITNHLAERGSRRWSLAWLLAVALTMGALLNLAYGTVTWFPGLLAARVLWGVCWSFIRHIGLMTVVDAAAESTRWISVGHAAARMPLISSIRAWSPPLRPAVSTSTTSLSACIAMAWCIAAPVPATSRGIPTRSA